MLSVAVTVLLTSCEKEDPQPATITANAGTDKTVEIGETVMLDGTASKGSANMSLSYAWSLVKKPAGSNALLEGATTTNPAFMPDKPGEYELELTVSSASLSHTDKVLVIATAATTPLVLDNITANTTLEDRVQDPALPDYVVNSRIGVDAQLTIKPGVVIAFAEDVAMDVNDGGVLIAKGEADKKIRFTGKAAQKGYWTGLMFFSNSSANEFSHVEILYAGSTGLVDDVKTALAVSDGARITIKNTTVAHSGGYGLYLRDGSTLYGFASNVFSNNHEAPVLLTAVNVPKLDAVTVFTSNNGRNIIEVQSSFINGPGEVVWQAFNDNTPYRLLGTMNVMTGWKLTPGITIEVAEDTHFDIGEGYIKAIGTAGKKITITGAVKTTGSWNGFVIYTRSSSNVMEHVDIKYAGGEHLISEVKTSIAVSHGGSLSIRNSTISNSGGYGIHVYGDDSTLNADVETSNTFTNNALAAIFYDYF